jgi:hypothetical protein
MEVNGQLHAPASLSQGKSSSQYPLDRRLGRTHNQCGCATERNLCPCQELNSSHPACSLVTILTELSQKSGRLYGHGIDLGSKHMKRELYSLISFAPLPTVMMARTFSVLLQRNPVHNRTKLSEPNYLQSPPPCLAVYCPLVII